MLASEFMTTFHPPKRVPCKLNINTDCEMKTPSPRSPSSETATHLNVVVFDGTKWNTSEDGNGGQERE